MMTMMMILFILSLLNSSFISKKHVLSLHYLKTSCRLALSFFLNFEFPFFCQEKLRHKTVVYFIVVICYYSNPPIVEGSQPTDGQTNTISSF